MLTSSRDNWERLVAAVVKRQQIWELCHQQSRTPSISTISSDDDDLSELTLSFSVPPSPQFPPKIPSVPQDDHQTVSKSASSRPLTRVLFSTWNRRRRKSKNKDLVDIPEDVATHLGILRRFSIDELRVATRDFSEIIASRVYRGWLADGSPVAVKRKQNVSVENDQFRREVEVNNVVAHPNVIRILGFCITQNERLLVYPLMVNGSVGSSLRERHKSKAPLNWPTRKGIALEAARGLTYLHEEIPDKKIIHRGINPANILLDEGFRAVLGDFGFGIIEEHDSSTPRVEIEVLGSIGYIAPEYWSTRRCSEKHDVYGYGVFLLELISGQLPYNLPWLADDDDDNDNSMYLDWVRRICKEGEWEKMVDADCESNYMEYVVKLLLRIALLCTRIDPEGRPKMSEVVRMIQDGDVLDDRRWEEWVQDEILSEEQSTMRMKKKWTNYENSTELSGGVELEDLSFNMLLRSEMTMSENEMMV